MILLYNVFSLSSPAFVSHTHLQKVSMSLSIHSFTHSSFQPIMCLFKQTFPKCLFCSRNTLNIGRGCKDELEMVFEHTFIQNQRSRVYYSKIPSWSAQKIYFCTLEQSALNWCQSAVNWSHANRSSILHFHFQNLPFPSFFFFSSQLILKIFSL